MSDVLSMLKAKPLGTRYVNVSDIIVKDMPRPLDEKWVNELMEVDVEKLPPIKVVPIGRGKYELLDGLHRLEVYKRKGIIAIRVELWKVPKENIYAAKVYFNSQHGKALTREERFKAFEQMIEKGSELTNEQLAKIIGVSIATIKRWKNRLGVVQQIRKLSEEDKKKIVALYREGYTQQEIAEMFGVDRTRITQILKECEEAQMSHLTSDDPDSYSSSEDDKVIPMPDMEEVKRNEVKESEETIDLNDIDDEDEEFDEEFDREVEKQMKEIVYEPPAVKAKKLFEKFHQGVKTLLSISQADIRLMEQFFDDVMSIDEQAQIAIDWYKLENKMEAFRDLIISLKKHKEVKDL